MDTIKNKYRILTNIAVMMIALVLLFGCADKISTDNYSNKIGNSDEYTFSKEIKNPELLNTILQNSSLSKEKKNELVNNLLNFLSDTNAENSSIVVTSFDELKLLNELLLNFGLKNILDETILVNGDGVKFPEEESYYKKIFESGYIIVTEYWYPAYNVGRSYEIERKSGKIKIAATVTEYEEVATGVTAFFDFVSIAGSPSDEAISLSYTTKKWQNSEK